MSTPVAAKPRTWERRLLLAFALVGVNCCGSPTVFFFADIAREEFHIRSIEHGYPRVGVDDPPARVWRIDWAGGPGDRGVHYAWSNWTNEEQRVNIGGFQVELPNRAPEAAYDPACPADECAVSVRIGGFLCARNVLGAYATGHQPCALRVWETIDGTKGCEFDVHEGIAPDPMLSGIPFVSTAPTKAFAPDSCPDDFRWDPGA